MTPLSFSNNRMTTYSGRLKNKAKLILILLKVSSRYYLNLEIITNKGDIEEIIVLSQFSKADAYVWFKLVPLQPDQNLFVEAMCHTSSRLFYAYIPYLNNYDPFICFFAKFYVIRSLHHAKLAMPKKSDYDL